MKFDGYRVLCRIERGSVQLLSRNGSDWTDRLPGIARAASRLGARSAMLDGEVAIVMPNGVTSFNALQNALGGGGGDEPVYFVFDLLYLDGNDLTGVPLVERKEALRALLESGDAGPTLRYSDHVAGNGEAFLRQACRMSLEGVVSKRSDAPYQSGRSRSWLKAKCIQEQEFVVGGFTDPEGSRSGIGALLLGVHDESRRLVYVGKVGTGFSSRAAIEIRRKLDRLVQPSPPFATRPPGAARAHWVRPTLVGEVEFTEWTPDGRLRHPSWKGLREDKPAREIVRERPAGEGGGSRPRASASGRAGRAKLAFVRARYPPDGQASGCDGNRGGGGGHPHHASRSRPVPSRRASPSSIWRGSTRRLRTGSFPTCGAGRRRWCAARRASRRSASTRSTSAPGLRRRFVASASRRRRRSASTSWSTTSRA